jgi:Tubulin/FtsZ family, GTPase domain.
LEIVDIYKYINEAVYRINDDTAEGFFRGRMATLSNIQTQDSGSKDVAVPIEDSFMIKAGEGNQTFAEYIGMETMSPETKDFLKLLYNASSKEDIYTELNLGLEVGFKGNPNIGSVIFNDVFKTNEFNYFRNSFTKEDRIFIVSSIFGGTGSSGLPQIVKKIRDITDKNNTDHLRRAVIGASVILPYFSVETDTRKKSAIDSGNFTSKAKAALDYYRREINHQLQEIYYLADEPTSPYSNVEGGTEQKNPAHIVELLSAMSIVEFVNRDRSSMYDDNTGRPYKTKYYEYGITNKSNPIRLDNFFPGEEQYLSQLTAFAYFYKFYVSLLPKSSRENYYKFLDFDSGKETIEFMRELDKFMHHYRKWLDEFSVSPTAFVPYNMQSEIGFNGMLGHKSVEGLDKKSIFKGGGSFFTDTMNNELNRVKDSANPQPSRELFVKIAYNTCKAAEKLAANK